MSHSLKSLLIATSLLATIPTGHALAADKPASQGGYAIEPGVPDWNGVWERDGNINWDPTVPGDQLDNPKLTPEYAARYKKGIDSMAAGVPSNDPTAACVPQGMPRIMNMVYPMEILQRRGQVAIYAEWMSQLRRIYTDGRKAREDLDPTYNGYSTGHWEGQELVVTTVGLRGDMMLTQYGLGLSDALIVKERFRQIDENTLTNTITLEDSKALLEPWTVTKRYKRAPGLEIMEYVCQENNRNPINPDGTTGTVLQGE